MGTLIIMSITTTTTTQAISKLPPSYQTQLHYQNHDTEIDHRNSLLIPFISGYPRLGYGMTARSSSSLSSLSSQLSSSSLSPSISSLIHSTRGGADAILEDDDESQDVDTDTDEDIFEDE